MKRQTSRRKWQALPIAAAAAFVVPTVSKGDVTVTFSEVDAGGSQTNVVATWSGNLNLQVGSSGMYSVETHPILVIPNSPANFTNVGLFEQIDNIAGTKNFEVFYFDYANVGTAETLSSVAFDAINPKTIGQLNGVDFSFGFNNTSFYWYDGVSNASSTPADLTQTFFDFDLATYTMTFENHNFQTLGIDGFSTNPAAPTLAWTANGTGDTISYVVPEPSALVLFGMSSLGLLLRRRRQS